MMKKLLTIFMLLAGITGSAQEEIRVAVFDPTSSGTSIDEGTKIAIREIISSTIVNAGGYNLVERSMLAKVMEEQSFSNSGVVDDSQATEIGKLAGANKVVLSVVTLTGGRNMISVKMIDVQTASVDRQKVKIVTSGELLDAIEPITLSLLDMSATSDTNISSNSKKSVGRNAPAQTAPQTVNTSNVRPEDLIPGPGELVLYLPAGYVPKKEKDKDLPIIAKFNREIIGSGTLSTGFCIRIPCPEEGKNNLWIGTAKIKLEPDKYNYYEFQVYRWNYLGKALYGVSLKERKFIR